MAIPTYLAAPTPEDQYQAPSFLDRVGTGISKWWDQTPPEAFFALSRAMLTPGAPFASKLGMGISGLGEAVAANKKKQGLAAAFDQFLPTVPEQYRPIVQQMVQNDPQALAGAVSAQMFAKPAETWKTVDANGDGTPDFQQSSISGEFKAMPRTIADDERIRRAGKSDTTVNVGGGSDKQIFDALGESYKMAQTANTGLQGLKEAEASLAKPGIYGAYADERLLLAKVAAAFGADPSAVVNTETFRSSIAPQVAAMVKSTVGSQNISNADREFAQAAAGGSIKLDKGTLIRLVKIGRKASESIVKGHNDRLNKIYPAGMKFDRERALFEIPMDAQPKQIKNQMEWQALKPGEQYIAPDGSLRVKQ